MAKDLSLVYNHLVLYWLCLQLDSHDYSLRDLEEYKQDEAVLVSLRLTFSHIILRAIVLLCCSQVYFQPLLHSPRTG